MSQSPHSFEDASPGAKAIDDKILAAGQPSPEQIEKLHNSGVSTIVNLRTPDEAGFLDTEEALVEGTGMTYAHVPISPGTLDDVAFFRFSQAVARSEGRVVVHCQGGGRAGLMSLLHIAVENGWSIDQAVEEGQRLGVWKENSPYIPFFEEYMRRHSAGERQ
jgi:uncharacterized protein (TIGR01244 family)